MDTKLELLGGAMAIVVLSTLMLMGGLWALLDFFDRKEDERNRKRREERNSYYRL